MAKLKSSTKQLLRGRWSKTNAPKSSANAGLRKGLATAIRADRKLSGRGAAKATMSPKGMTKGVKAKTLRRQDSASRASSRAMGKSRNLKTIGKRAT